MMDWALDTLIWTAALIALVLLVRRPVARWFGPQMAYALWALPALRLVLPPIELPAWLAPEPAANELSPTTTFLILDPATPVATPETVAGSSAAASGQSTPITPLSFFEVGPAFEVGIAVWLIGAAIFLWLRFGAYFRLRAELLADAREVGRSGKVRLVETPGTEAPLAFGVIDKVVALPEDFMALPDRTARDLALAHELAHHKGRDLLVNILVQPLFALHWWNPLGRYGWLALRRDQEAACDARVVESKPTEERAAYATLIASFAAGPNVALAAPMACPVLGDKSIIHRLRSLNMSETPSGRRKTGRLMLGAAVLALPLTASISYAASEVPAQPAPPAPPSASVAPPAPPTPPAPPAAPLATSAEAIVTVDPDTGEERIVETKKNVVVIRDVDTSTADGKVKRVEKVHLVNKGDKMTEEEMEAIMAEVREGLAEANEVIKDVPRLVEEAMIEVEQEGVPGRTVVKMECRGDDIAHVEEIDDNAREVFICQTKVMAEARKGLEEARKAISKNREMSEEMRERVLKELDRQIESWDDAAG